MGRERREEGGEMEERRKIEVLGTKGRRGEGGWRDGWRGREGGMAGGRAKGRWLTEGQLRKERVTEG